MSEKLFKEILWESLKCEYAEFDNASDHRFSLKHRLAMKRIFAKFERNVQKQRKERNVENTLTVEYKPSLNFRQRIIVALLIVILMSFLVGWVVVFVSEKFHGMVYQDNTLLTAIDYENCPKTIEYKYTIASVPEDFEMIETNSSPIDVYTRYKNKHTNQIITLYQCVKTDFSPHYNTEYYQFEEVSVNDKNVLCVDFGDESSDHTLVVWDNGDYIIEIIAHLDKSETLKLSNIAKV